MENEEHCHECDAVLIKTEDEKFEYYKCEECGETDFVISKELMKEARDKYRGVGSQSR